LIWSYLPVKLKMYPPLHNLLNADDENSCQQMIQPDMRAWYLSLPKSLPQNPPFTSQQPNNKKRGEP